MNLPEHIITTLLMAVSLGQIGRADETLTKASKGDADAQIALGIRFRDADGMKRDYTEAMRWAHRAADQGHAGAMDFIGWMFFSGTGVAHQPKLAAGYVAAAADESAEASWILGQCLFAAQGVDHDIPKALETWRTAEDKRHGRAASTAAMVLLAGDGVPAEPAAARRLAERAAELNDRNGLVVLGEVRWQAGEMEMAREAWTKVAAMSTTGTTCHPEQSGDQMAAQQGADMLKLMEYRQRKNEPGKFAFLPVPHVHQGWNNCGATSCAMFSRSLSKPIGSPENSAPRHLGREPTGPTSSKRRGRQNSDGNSSPSLTTTTDSPKPPGLPAANWMPAERWSLISNTSARTTPAARLDIRFCSTAILRRKISTFLAIPPSPHPASSLSPQKI